MNIFKGKIRLNGGGIRVTLNEERSIASLQSDRESLEKVFNLFRIVLSPAPCALTGHILQEFYGARIPSAKSLNHN